MYVPLGSNGLEIVVIVVLEYGPGLLPHVVQVR